MNILKLTLDYPGGLNVLGSYKEEARGSKSEKRRCEHRSQGGVMLLQMDGGSNTNGWEGQESSSPLELSRRYSPVDILI